MSERRKWMTGKPGDIDQTLAAFRESGQSRDYLLGMIYGVVGTMESLERALSGPQAEELLGFIGQGLALYRELLLAYDESMLLHSDDPLYAGARAAHERTRQAAPRWRRVPPWEELSEMEQRARMMWVEPIVHAVTEADERLRARLRAESEGGL